MSFCARWLTAIAAAISLTAGAAPAAASIVIYRTDAQLVSASERVVHGRVIAQRAVNTGQRIYTVTTLQVIQDMTGVAGSTIEIWELGGTDGQVFFYVGGGVEYRPGEEVLVLLERGPLGYRSVAMGFSKFDVLPAVNGERALRRNLAGTVVVGGALATRERSLSEFRDLVTSLTGRQPHEPAIDPAVAVQYAAQPFTLLGGANGYRWREADNGTPVIWYKNTSAPNPLLSGDAVNEIQLALSAWTSPATASIVLQYGGTTNQSNPDGPWSGIPANSSVITFEDPLNEINDNVLAIGGGWGSLNAGGTVNGNTFHAFTRGYVIFQNAADLSTSFKQSLNFSRVLEHEIGHAIGLGHTQTDGSVANATQNIMYPSCCSGNTPTPPSIGPDDLAGLTFIYPVTNPGPSCSYSISPTSAASAAGGGSGSVTVTTQAGCAWTASGGSGFISVTGGWSGSGPGTVSYSVAANPQITPRSGTLAIAGHTFTVNQAAMPCSYTLSTTSATMTVAGGNGSVNVVAPSGCAWTAATNSGFVSITSAASGSGNGTVAYNVGANGVSGRHGILTIAGNIYTIVQAGSGPVVTLDKAALRYGATLSGTLLTSQTTAQTLRLTQAGGAPVSWNIITSHPWLSVTPSSGSGNRELTVAIDAAALSTPAAHSATITISTTGAGNIIAPVQVTLTTMMTGQSAPPFGLVDTPLDNATGVTGAVPFTGWAADDVEVANVFICRGAVAGEGAPNDPNCGGAAQIFVGSGVFIDGTRPDVQAGLPLHPRNSRAGWGFMVLTNMLPAQGNGMFVFHVYALDREGHIVPIGSRTIFCDNANATKPFGTIDTPGQGDTAAGASYVNFGWVLTQQPKFIPTNGSTISVFVDGVSLGAVSYNHPRADIAALFPGLANSDGAIGFKIIDTTALADGLHTISWTATDSGGNTDGIGSRFFRVANGIGALTADGDAAAPAVLASTADLALAPLDPGVLQVRRGWQPDAPWRSYGVRSGRAIVRGEELDRFEIQLPLSRAGRYRGYLRVAGELAPLPIGSSIDAGTARFVWAPGLGFIGSYDFVFVRWERGSAVARHEVRVVLHPKGSNRIGPQVVIDIPTSQQSVGAPFAIGGWAIDLGAGTGTGIETLHVWAYPAGGGTPVFVGEALYGGGRPDVAAVHGDEYLHSGYGLLVQGLAPGTYDLAVFGWSSVTADFVPASLVRVTVR